MKIIKKILFGILGLIALLMIVAIFIPKTYSVTVNHSFHQPQTKVFDYIKILENQKVYSEWLKPDPNTKTTLTGQDGEVGANMTWLGNDQVGEGSQEIKSIAGDKIDVELKFIKPMASVAQISYSVIKKSETDTDLLFTFNGNSPYPMNLLSYLVGIPMIRNTTKKNFENIDGILK